MSAKMNGTPWLRKKGISSKQKEFSIFYRNEEDAEVITDWIVSKAVRECFQKFSYALLSRRYIAWLLRLPLVRLWLLPAEQGDDPDKGFGFLGQNLDYYGDAHHFDDQLVAQHFHHQFIFPTHDTYFLLDILPRALSASDDSLSFISCHLPIRPVSFFTSCFIFILMICRFAAA